MKRDSSEIAADAQLVARARAGDLEAFGALVVRHQDRLYNSLWRMVGSHEDAQDAVQEAFVQAFLNLPRFRGDCQFSTWLYRIGVNQALTARRRRRPTASLEARKDDLGAEPMDSDAGPLQTAERHEDAVSVHAALQKLDPPHRQVLVLRELEGYCYEKIAEILEVPVGTVRSRLFRARLQLRDHLGSPEA